MIFNPAFFDTTHLDSRAAKRVEQRDDIDHQPRVAPGNVINGHAAAMIQALEQAAARFAIRRDNFAVGKQAICLDIAAKLERFGSFASDKQADFAAKLVEWSKPRQEFTLGAIPHGTSKAPASPVAAPQPVAAAVTLPKLFELMQRLSKLTIGVLTIARKNQDSLCWVKLEGVDKVVGKIEGGTLTLFTGRLANTTAPEVLVKLLQAIERDPEAAAVQHGKLSGRCSVCSRDLTDPASIERGIGPICADKF